MSYNWKRSASRTILTGTNASRPAAGIAGRTYLPTDGTGLVYRDNGTTWQGFGPVFPMTEPVDGDFAWVNQGSATVTTTNGGVILYSPAAAHYSLRIRKKAAPATPYTITACFIPTLICESVQQCGIGFRESSSGKLHCFPLSAQSTAPSTWLGAHYFNSATSENSLVKYLEAAPLGKNYIWFRISDDGVDRKSYYSLNGLSWVEFHSVSRTTFITADEVFFYIGSSSNYPVYSTLLSWKEA